jgi:protoporphyrinogen oxidase
MKIAVVGGGIMGISLGYFLAQEGVKVDIYEASPNLGGLASQILLEDGTSVDRFYHTILSSDVHLHQLCDELKIADQLRFRETGMGFYHRGEIHPMNGIIDFLRFPPLGWMDRLRLGLAVLYAQFVRDWRRLEGISTEEWLLRLSGYRTYENIWCPMLRAKFADGFDSIPATYIWARLVRMKSTRTGLAQKELVGHLIGGHLTLIKAMARWIEKVGGKVHLGSPVQEIMIENGRAWGLRFGSKAIPYDAVVATMQVPIYRHLIPDAYSSYHGFLDETEYMGIIAPLLVLDRPLTGYWTLNITDDRFSYTGVIETTTYIDPQFVGGHHLVYLPKYTAPGSWWQQLSDEEIRSIWLHELETMFPSFDRGWIRYFPIDREQYSEPLHRLNGTDHIPSIKTPVENLYLATTAQIYPELTNGESVSKHARRAAYIVLEEQERLHLAQTSRISQASVNDRVVV